MTRDFTTWIVFMFVLVIVGLMFDGFDSKRGIVTTVIISLVAAVVVYLLYPTFTQSKK